MKQGTEYSPQGYDPGKGMNEIATKLSLNPYEIVKLDANENMFIPRSFLQQLMIKTAKELDPRFYGIDEKNGLQKRIAAYEEVSFNDILIGAGADQLIDLVIKAFATNGDRVFSLEPTFSMYQACAYSNGIPYKAIPLTKAFALDIDALLSEIDAMTGICFICSPNNPTSNQFALRDIEKVCQSFKGIVVVDETYVAFADYSTKELLKSYSNLLILRSFSKSWGIAGLRLGYLLASEGLCGILNLRFQLPYPASSFAMALGEKLIDLSKYISLITDKVKAERELVIKKLNGLSGVRAFQSKTNFILFSVPRVSSEISRSLMKEGILVRDLGKVGHVEDCLRITVPPREVGERFIERLEAVL